jgi:hypothetical protein
MILFSKGGEETKFFGAIFNNIKAVTK